MEESYPIRMLFGIGDNLSQGFSIVIEKRDCSAKAILVWYDRDLFNKVRFIEDGESRVIYEDVITIGLFNESKKQLIKEILIRKDFFLSKQ